MDTPLDPIDRALVSMTQEGLPLVPAPFAKLAEVIGIPEDEVIARFTAMKNRGLLRRIAAVPNHFALGYRANAMTVWDVDDTQIAALGERIGALPFVSHCYQRPRRLPQWPYNLFAMVHAHNREEAALLVTQIAETLGAACRAHDILYSTRILKKTGLRIRPGD